MPKCDQFLCPTNGTAAGDVFIFPLTWRPFHASAVVVVEILSPLSDGHHSQHANMCASSVS